MHPLKRDILDIYLTTFSDSVISECHLFFPKFLKFNVDFKKVVKNLEKVFCFWDNCIWIGIIKVSLLRRRYLPSVPNVLTSSPKIWYVNKRDFLQVNWLGGDQWIWQGWSDEDFDSAWARLPYYLSEHPLQRNFLDIYLTTFLESQISKRQKLWGSSFSQNVQNLL